MAGDVLQNRKHFSEDCVIYREGGLPCEDCLTVEEERDFWKECYTGSHNGPDDCPTYYDGCNCAGTLGPELERVLGLNRAAARVMLMIHEADALQQWAYEGDGDEPSIAEELRAVHNAFKKSFGRAYSRELLRPVKNLDYDSNEPRS